MITGSDGIINLFSTFLFWDVIKLDSSSLGRSLGVAVIIQETICIFIRPSCRNDLVSAWQSCLRQNMVRAKKSEIESTMKK